MAGTHREIRRFSAPSYASDRTRAALASWAGGAAGAVLSPRRWVLYTPRLRPHPGPPSSYACPFWLSRSAYLFCPSSCPSALASFLSSPAIHAKNDIGGKITALHNYVSAVKNTMAWHASVPWHFTVSSQRLPISRPQANECLPCSFDPSVASQDSFTPVLL